uniref:Uncharacterized protein n=1 Tax=Kuenenia stuttgartiensis TaxID=174633 RepID=Q1PW82_KUEST|nr:unknown protein [Candidatus Kuenenia stuttgartiensis]
MFLVFFCLLALTCSPFQCKCIKITHHYRILFGYVDGNISHVIHIVKSIICIAIVPSAYYKSV